MVNGRQTMITLMCLMPLFSTIALLLSLDYMIENNPKKLTSFPYSFARFIFVLAIYALIRSQIYISNFH
jgi:hypothetical protein